MAQSLNRRDGLHQQRSLALWLRHILDAEKSSRKLPRTFINFQSLLEDWGSSFDKLQNDLGLVLPFTSDSIYSEVESEISANLKHYTITKSRIGRTYLSQLATRAYEALLDLEQGEKNRLFEIFDAISSDFEPISETLGPILVSQDNSIEQANVKINQLNINLIDEKHKNDQLTSENSGLLEQNKQLSIEVADFKDLEQEYLKVHLELSEISALYQNTLSERNNLESQLNAVFESTSWKVSSPIRWVKIYAAKPLTGFLRPIATSSFKLFWKLLPLTKSAKVTLKSKLFSLFPSLFNKTSSFLAWKNQTKEQHFEQKKNEAVFSPDQPFYTPRLITDKFIDPPVKLIAFYLPQFHPIPENDKWWGKGFTEWTNVKPAQPQFEGHYQPREPSDLGYYDLRNLDVQKRQVELAESYGISGFCFYFYWFHSKRLLEQPIKQYLKNPELKLPFCLCWANENWSRRWDGLDKEILIAQEYSPEDDIAFIRHISEYLQDNRYIHVEGKPLLLIYRPALLPRAKSTARRWRKWCRENGVGEIFLAYTQSFENVDPSFYGFDAAIEFPPNNISPVDLSIQVPGLKETFKGNIYDGNQFVQQSKRYVKPSYTLFRSVCPSWDNTARRKSRGTIFANMSVKNYHEWLRNAISDTLSRFTQTDKQIIFINAWNEWAEGAYLEPDKSKGYSYLQATHDALTASTQTKAQKSILLVTHDCHPHGAQFLLLEIAKCIKSFGFDLYLIALDSGKLHDDFRALGKFICTNESTQTEVEFFLSNLLNKGVNTAITSTVVSGALVPKLKQKGLKVISLIHELPGVIKDMGQERNALSIAKNSDQVIFPAELVSSSFAKLIDISKKKMVVRHQGLLRKNPFKSNKIEARRLVRARHNLTPQTKIILTIGYGDKRKGIDLFLDIAKQVLATESDIVFIWVGHLDASVEKNLKIQINTKSIFQKIIFTGYIKEPLEYYAAADLYALTSREDPFPNVVLEALEVSLPIVGFTGTTGASDLILEQKGKLVESFNTKAYSKAIIEYLADSSSGNKPELSMIKGSLRRYALDLLSYSENYPRISVILPNFEYEQHILDRLESIAKQTYPIYELIVLDDASNDNSPKLIQTFLESCPIDSIYIANKENSGSVFRQWKKGLERCSGDLVWIAEADDLSEKDFLYHLMQEFKNPDLVLAYSQSKQIDKNGNILAENYLEYTKDVSSKWNSDYINSGIDEIRETLSIKNTIPNVSATLIKREALDQAILSLGEDLFEFQVAGDWLVYLELLKQGDIAFKKDSLNLHRRHDTSITSTSAGLEHIKEVKNAQVKAQKIIQADETIKEKADAYISHLHHYFDVA
ncbi:MAG: glycoside hydrolase family 99-like domain-containing protein [Pseudomonadales bacterium]|nr:glycoside hydrolase family 99-like domain-containing protein [Pseudomonadales bacterium]